MARIGIAGFQHETNDFVREPTRLRDFREASAMGEILEGAAILSLPYAAACATGFAQRASALGHTLVPLVSANAEPGGRVERAAFDTIVDLIKGAIGDAGTLDAIYLELHGAMLVENDDDGDALVAEILRPLLPSGAPIVASMDLHANVSARTLAAFDGVVAYRTYPHVDMGETGEAAADLLHECLDLGRKPAAAIRQLPFMIPVNRQCTLGEPLGSVYSDIAHDLGDPELLSMSFTPGFQMADIEAPLPTVFAFARSPEAAEQAVARIHDSLLANEESFDYDYVSVDEAVRRAARHSGDRPLILADAQDNPGGGSSGDGTTLLHALLAAGVSNVAIAALFDPAAAAAAVAAGSGTRRTFALGGRGIPGEYPVTGEFEVVTATEEPAWMEGPMFGGLAVDLGPSALLRIAGIDVVVISKRLQCLDQGFFRHVGIDPAAYRVLVLKSAIHFRCDFDTVSDDILDVAAPGLEVVDYSSLPYTRLRDGVRYWGNGPAHRLTRASAALR